MLVIITNCDEYGDERQCIKSELDQLPSADIHG